MRMLLFTTTTCPHCGPAKELLSNSCIEGIEYLNATEHMDLVKEFGIRSVPTLVFSKDNNNQSFVGVDEIKKFIELMKDDPSCKCGCGKH